MPNTDPHTDINLQEVNARNDNARYIVADCAAAMPTLTDMWRYLQDAPDDTLAVSAEITRLPPKSSAPGLTAPTCSPRCATMRQLNKCIVTCITQCGTRTVGIA